MNCIEFDQAIRASIENREPDERLAEHAENCTQCAEIWRIQNALDRVIDQWASQLPQVDLTDAVLSDMWNGELVASNRGRRSPESPVLPVVEHSSAPGRVVPWNVGSQPSPRSGGWSVLAVVAGVLLLMLRIGMHSDDLNSRGDLESGTPLPHRSASTLPPRPPAAELSNLFEETRSAYWSLAREAGDAASSVSVLLPPRDYERPIDQTEQPSGVFEHWKRHLEPIGRDVGKAFGFLLDAVPGEPSSRT